MKKRLIVVFSAILCLAVATTVVIAAQGNFLTARLNSQSESNNIKTILKDSNVLNSYFGPSIMKDTNGEIVESEEIVVSYDTLDSQMSAMALIGEENEVVQTDVMADGIKIYSVTIDENMQSIYNSLSAENDMWIIPNDVNNVVSFTYLKIGEDSDVVAERINNLNISDSRKEKLLKKAQEQEGQWYVAYIQEKNSASDARKFVNQSEIQEVLIDNNVTDIVDYKHINIQNNGQLAICVKTSTSEYIIPYGSDSELSNNELYSINDIKEYIAG